MKSTETPDPIFAAIETHRAARKLALTAKQDNAPEFEVEEDTASALLDVKPTTLGGVCALASYAASVDAADRCADYDDGMGCPITWHQFVIANLAEVLPTLA
jgi:hypothetical protein